MKFYNRICLVRVSLNFACHIKCNKIRCQMKVLQQQKQVMHLGTSITMPFKSSFVFKTSYIWKGHFLHILPGKMKHYCLLVYRSANEGIFSQMHYRKNIPWFSISLDEIKELHMCVC